MAVRKFEVPCVVRMKFLGTEVAQNRDGKVRELHAAASFTRERSGQALGTGSGDWLWGPAPSPVEPRAPPPAPGP